MTRSYLDIPFERTCGLSSGLYRIAVGANVPLLPSAIDRVREEAGIIACLEFSGDPEGGLMRIAETCTGRHGRHPDLASPTRWLPTGQTNDKKPTPC